MSLRLNGSTSGYVELDAPAAAGSNTLVLPNGNGTSGQYLQTNGSGTLSWQTVASLSNAEDGTGTDFEFNSGYGSNATAYGVRAWCYGDLVGTIAIHESGGVTSLTDSALGQFIVNFSFTFPDVNYAVTGTATDGSGEANFLAVRTAGTNPVRSTTAISMEIYTYQGGRIDAEFGLAVLR